MTEENKTFIATKEYNAVLVLSDGDFWIGQSIGSLGQSKGEICFNVSMTGYQEIITDPSYADQIITFTFPHIGNTGCNIDDIESESIFATGLVLRNPISESSNFRSTSSFSDWLKINRVVGLCGVDTRELTRNIREKGPRASLVHCAEIGDSINISDLIQSISKEPTLLGKELASKVSTKDSYTWNESIFQNGQTNYTINQSGDYCVVVIDYGIKKNILRSLVNQNFKVVVVPSSESFNEIIKHKPDGIFLSNGPGDPFSTFANVKETLDHILEKNIPLFGICLGNQLLALASGLKTLKLHGGHRGGNHPVKRLNTNTVEITSQNHGFCVSDKDIPENIEITHKSLFDNTVEGIRRKDKWAFAVQYHPESSPGPHDSHYLFKDFYSMIKASKDKIAKKQELL